jgi:hypothetical protein
MAEKMIKPTSGGRRVFILILGGTTLPTPTTGADLITIMSSELCIVLVPQRLGQHSSYVFHLGSFPVIAMPTKK